MTTLLVFLGTAQAQTWNVNNEWNFDFLGCSRLSTGFVECVMSAEYVGKNSQYSANFSAQYTKTVTPDGQEFAAKTSAIVGKDTTFNNVNVFQNVPVRVTYAIPYPKDFSTIRMLFISGKRFDNVPIMGGPPAAPAGATLKAELYDIQLSGCAATTGGGYTCSGAVITPKK